MRLLRKRKAMIVEKLNVVYRDREWVIDIGLSISEEMADYWDLDTEEEVKDFIGYLLNRR